jgi:hypothetical protein
MTTFEAAIAICGLSKREAAEFLDVAPDMIDAWARGASAPPRAVWGSLADLYARIEDAADSVAEELEPDGMDGPALNAIEVGRGIEPLPGGAGRAAGALALLLTIQSGAMKT